MRKAIAVLVVATQLLGFLAHAQMNEEEKTYNVRLYGLAQQFEWKEYLAGREILKESGPLFGLGADLALRIQGVFWFEGRGEFFFGEVDYDGAIQTLDGQLLPYESKTTYVGFKADGSLALKFPLSDAFYAKPYAGLGLRSWRRTLDKKASDKDIGQYGYTEDWVTIYGIIGLGGGVAVFTDGELFARVEARIPLKNSMEADLSNVRGPSDAELEPGKRPTVYAEAGLNVRPLTVSVFYETLDFSESDMDSKYNAVFQPESKGSMLGVKLGLFF